MFGWRDVVFTKIPNLPKDSHFSQICLKFWSRVSSVTAEKTPRHLVIDLSEAHHVDLVTAVFSLLLSRSLSSLALRAQDALSLLQVFCTLPIP